MSRKKRASSNRILDERKITVLVVEDGELVEESMSLKDAVELYFEYNEPLYIHRNGKVERLLIIDVLDRISVFTTPFPEGKDYRSRIVYLSILLQGLNVGEEYLNIICSMAKGGGV